jgi:hypothetical protein
MAINYAAEKFGSAIHGIVTAYEPETLQERIYGCMMVTGVLSKDDFPSGLWDRFKKLRDRMTQVQDEQRGSFRATADTLSDKEAHDWIVEFYDISTEVEEAYNESR